MDSRSNQILRKGYQLPGVEHVLGETGLDVARLFLARLLARLRHPLAFAYLLLPPPPLPPHGPIQDGRARCRLLTCDTHPCRASSRRRFREDSQHLGLLGSHVTSGRPIPGARGGPPRPALIVDAAGSLHHSTPPRLPATRGEQSPDKEDVEILLPLALVTEQLWVPSLPILGGGSTLCTATHRVT